MNGILGVTQIYRIMDIQEISFFVILGDQVKMTQYIKASVLWDACYRFIIVSCECRTIPLKMRIQKLQRAFQLLIEVIANTI